MYTVIVFDASDPPPECVQHVYGPLSEIEANQLRQTLEEKEEEEELNICVFKLEPHERDEHAEMAEAKKWFKDHECPIHQGRPITQCGCKHLRAAPRSKVSVCGLGDVVFTDDRDKTECPWCKRGELNR